MTAAQVMSLWVGALAIAAVKLLARALVEKAWKRIRPEPPE